MCLDLIDVVCDTNPFIFCNCVTVNVMDSELHGVGNPSSSYWQLWTSAGFQEIATRAWMYTKDRETFGQTCHRGKAKKEGQQVKTYGTSIIIFISGVWFHTQARSHYGCYIFIYICTTLSLEWAQVWTRENHTRSHSAGRQRWLIPRTHMLTLHNFPPSLSSLLDIASLLKHAVVSSSLS